MFPIENYLYLDILVEITL
jgi:hypothetical protein